MPRKTSPKSRRGPEPDTVKIEGDWETAVGKALANQRPKEGWPPPEKKRASPKRAEREKRRAASQKD